MRLQYLSLEFLDTFPNILEEGILYISIKYANMAHKCCCGCGNDVFTPLSPKDWTLVYDGESVSLSPSIGNWRFTCQSHYYVKKNKIVWLKSQYSNDEKEIKKIKKKHTNFIHKIFHKLSN